MKKERLMELAGVQLMEAAGNVYVATFDGGDGTYLGIVGPFKSDSDARAYFDGHKELEDIRIEYDEPLSPDDYLKTFKEDE